MANLAATDAALGRVRRAMDLYEKAYEGVRRRDLDLKDPRNAPFVEELLEARSGAWRAWGRAGEGFPFSRPPG
jgi:hypothetical protein